AACLAHRRSQPLWSLSCVGGCGEMGSQPAGDLRTCGRAASLQTSIALAASSSLASTLLVDATLTDK
ncbi:unnamed protein product, partial [Musa textilis]